MPLIRSIAKSLTWRVIGVFLLSGLAWAFTGDVLETVGIAAAFNGIRMVLFVFHEEAWERWAPLARIGRAPVQSRAREPQRAKPLRVARRSPISAIAASPSAATSAVLPTPRRSDMPMHRETARRKGTAGAPFAAAQFGTSSETPSARQ